VTQQRIALLLFLAALGLVGARVIPVHASAAAIWRQTEALRSQAERGGRRAPLERAARRDALANDDSLPGARARRVRRDVLAVLATLPLAGVTLEVRESPNGPAVAEVRLGAKGRFSDLVELTGRLAKTPGLVLSVVRFSPRDTVALVEIEARSR
jgi:hypothetical protein